MIHSGHYQCWSNLKQLKNRSGLCQLEIFEVLTLYKLDMFISLNPKRAGGAESAPLDIFCYISAGCYFFSLKLHDFFLQALRSI